MQSQTGTCITDTVRSCDISWPVTTLSQLREKKRLKLELGFKEEVEKLLVLSRVQDLQRGSKDLRDSSQKQLLEPPCHQVTSSQVRMTM